MTLKPVRLSALISVACRQCRPFLHANVALWYRVPVSDTVAMLDERRVLQILTNGLSNAGKFTSHGAVLVDVNVITVSCIPEAYVSGPLRTVKQASSNHRDGSRGVSGATVGCVHDTQYLTITVSNTRCLGNAGGLDPEAVFVPFRGTFNGSTVAGSLSLQLEMMSSAVPPLTNKYF